MNQEKKLLSNFIHLFSLQGLTFILPLITMPYLFRVLGAEKFGLVAFSLATITFFKVLVDYGFHLTATREISINRNNKEKLIEIFSRTLIVKFILLIISFIILNVFILLIDKFSENWLLFYISFLFVFGHTVFPIWFFQGIEEMKYISYLNIISKLLFTVGVFLFISSSSDYLIYPLLNGLSILFVGTYAIFLINKKYNIKLRRQPFFEIKKTFKNGWNVFLAEFAPNMYSNFTTFFLAFIVSMESVGYYSLANKVIDISSSIMYIIRNVTFPYLNKNFDKFKKITLITIVVGFIFTIIIFSFSHIIIPFVFGEKASNILNLIYILAITPFLFAFTLSFGSNYLLILKKDKKYRKIVLTVSLFGMLLSLILVPLFGIYGGVITVISIRVLLAFFITKSAFTLKAKNRFL
jgi:PST family polysaccharide transporter